MGNFDAKKARAYLDGVSSESQDEWTGRRHADGSKCEAESAETCPKEKDSRKADEIPDGVSSASSGAGNAGTKRLDFENVRSLLAKFNYKTNFGNEVEYTEAPEARWNKMVIQGYKSSQGWGGGSNVSVSQATAAKMVDELKKKFKVDSWRIEGGKVVLDGDFS